MKDLKTTNISNNIDLQSIKYDIKVTNYLIEEIKMNKKLIDAQLLKNNVDLMTHMFLLDSLLSRMQTISKAVDEKLFELDCK